MVRLGHSSPRAALIYQHASRERDAAAVNNGAERGDRLDGRTGQRGLLTVGSTRPPSIHASRSACQP